MGGEAPESGWRGGRALMEVHDVLLAFLAGIVVGAFGVMAIAESTTRNLSE